MRPLADKYPGRMPRGTKRRHVAVAAVAAVLLACLIFAAYCGVFRVFFLGEDFTWLWRCRLDARQSWWDVLTNDVMVGIYSWRPLVQLSFALNEAWFGQDLTSYRAEALFWHWLGAVGLLGIGWRLSGAAVGCIAAAVYAIHPLHVESLAWTCARGGPMSVAFAALAILAHLLWRDRRLPLLAVALPFALALATQETAVTVLPILLCADLLLPRTAQSAAARIKLYFVLLAIVGFALWARAAQSPAGVAVPFGEIGSGIGALAHRAWFAVSKLPRALAAVLTVSPPAASGHATLRLFAAVLFAASAAAAYLRWRRGRAVALWSLAWIGLSLAPYLAFLMGPFPRHFSLAMAGFGLLAGELGAALWRQVAGRNRAVLVLLAIVWSGRVLVTTHAEVEKYVADGMTTRRFIEEIRQLVPRAQPGATFAFYRVGALRSERGILVYGLDDAVRLLYDDGTLQVVFPELGRDQTSTYHLLYEGGHLRRLASLGLMEPQRE